MLREGTNTLQDRGSSVVAQTHGSKLETESRTRLYTHCQSKDSQSHRSASADVLGNHQRVVDTNATSTTGPWATSGCWRSLGGHRQGGVSRGPRHRHEPTAEWRLRRCIATTLSRHLGHLLARLGHLLARLGHLLARLGHLLAHFGLSR